jgi:hypothetical protein
MSKVTEEHTKNTNNVRNNCETECLLSRSRARQDVSFITIIQHCAGNSGYCKKTRKKHKDWNEKPKTFLFTDDIMIIPIKLQNIQANLS